MNKVSQLTEDCRTEYILKQRNKKQSRFYSVTTELKNSLDEYCKHSTLHGLKYIRDTTLPATDRVFWTGMFLLSLVMGNVVFVIWRQETDSFVIVHDSEITPIWKIPFPTVTICTYFMIKKSYMDLSHNNNRLYKEYSQLACSDPEVGVDIPDIADYFEFPDIYTGEDFYLFLKNATQSCKEIFKSCNFKRRSIDCCTVFQPILTHLGYCYMFNSIPYHIMFKTSDTQIQPPPELQNTIYWNPEKGYPQNHIVMSKTTNILPYWLEYQGEYLGLIVELYQNMSDWQLPCSNGHIGFQAIINSPDNSPVLSASAFRIPTNMEISLALTPLFIHTDDSLSGIAPEQRGCFYSHEKELTFFQFYTYTNCIQECYGQLALRKCDCIPYFIPKNLSLRMCFSMDSECVSTIWGDVIKEVTGKSNISLCRCMPSCTELAYKTSHYYSPFATTENSTAEIYDVKKKDNLVVSRLQIYYKTQDFAGLLRQKDMSFYDFLGVCGGLLGLFVGFSFISGFEVIYFFLLRPLLNANKTHV